ncbi:uncharacterized protein LOC106715742 [Papilio machaon]|uniref:uncharacterized protein LOC106715742 n=1 Tax=Papilio machaon TaxID=76193 RepID=UPI001E664D48|nr:uncharacterized protein LOC106715742 [Papilio machaon]
MVITRSQGDAADAEERRRLQDRQEEEAQRQIELERRLRLHPDPPASPILHRSYMGERSGDLRVDPLLPTTTTTDLSSGLPIHEDRRRLPTMSQRSNVSVNSRLRLAELKAAERLAAIKKKELELEADLVKKWLAAEISVINDDRESLPDVPFTPAQEREKVVEWLHSNPPEPRGEIVGGQRNEPRATQRTRSPTPTRRSGIEQLAATLENMARPRLRHTDLPIFSGDVNEWLPFYAAYKDTTNMYGVSSAENIQRLRSCLKGEARNAVAALLHAASDPDIIIKTLEQCFGRPEVLIDRALEELKRLPKPESSATELNAFAIKVQNTVCVLQTIDKRGYLYNPLLAREILDKLSPHLRSRWCNYAHEHEDATDPEITLLSRFLMREADRTLRFAYAPATSTSTTNAAKREIRPAVMMKKKTQPVYAVAEYAGGTIVCPSCEQQHSLTECPKYKELAVEQRWELVKEKKICFRCIRSKHRRIVCRAKACGVNACRRPHHSSLHEEAKPDPEKKSEEEAVLSVAPRSATGPRSVLLKICPVVISGPRGELKTHALLDEGATITLIDEGLAQLIGAEGPSEPLHLHGVNMEQNEHSSRRVSLSIRGLKEERSFNLKARTIRNLRLHRQSITKDLLKGEHLKDLDSEEISYDEARPGILVGTDHWECIVSRELRVGRPDQPAASRTQLGWVVHGTVPRTIAQNECVLHVYEPIHQCTNDQDLHELMEDHFTTKDFGVSQKSHVSDEVQREMNIVEKSIKRIDGGCKKRLLRKHDHRIANKRTDFRTDYITAVHWVHHDARRYTPFVAHRLREITELTQKHEWSWLPTDLNVADNATRLSNSVINVNDRWFRGPAFLCEPESEWPTEIISEPKEAEVMHVTEDKRKTNSWLPDPERFSKYETLVGATARAIAFVDIGIRRSATRLECRHLEQAERLLIQHAQRQCFGEEMNRIEAGRPIQKSSRLYRLDPVIEDGVLKVRGRIEAASTPASVKRPIILDDRHTLTKLIVLRKHCAAGHANRELVINDLRQRYWIIHLRPTVRTVERNCAFCRVRRTKPRQPVTGDLPRARLDPFHRPFTNCGVDYFGPMTVKIGRRREKRWSTLFTCLTSRAIHIEIVASLSTDSAIMALRRMAARRGWPRLASELRGEGLRHRMEWRFIPPSAPNQGGAWERLIRSVKTALNAALKEQAPTEEVLRTVLTEIEFSVNARPLTHVSVDPLDPEALTPNHFLLGSSTGIPTTGSCDAADRRTWRASQALADHFWRRWVREYLPTLVPRGESGGGERPLQTGDIVVIADPTLPRNVWPLGVVSRTYPGPDGGVRVVDVKTRTGVFKRPVSKIVALGIEEATQAAPGGELLAT